ncbi:RNA polymerase II degradation factor 1 [Cinnamomum micranthum f. kanehirae]|uniref:RNA polymerase II degradation factor 1 n=1 Tax=Cinnamomum micranthum f. kanehirae TaxID=337451 RepID=A0A3S3QU13_9MAGN|nr:RNA polymerase II degradation factor 1 [Cinnamomum micranthum f. kanehirae]
MASGSSGRNSSGSKAFDFGSDDVICSIDDFSSQDASNGRRIDSTINTSSGMDYRESRLGRSLVNAYNKQEDSFHQEVLATVEKTMKKYADTILRSLEGISSRLSQLELYCYNVEQSIGDLRSDLTRDHGEADVKLRSLEKHLKEVHRSVQILRDKQELSDTQKELEKLQLVKELKEAAAKSQSQQQDDGVASSASESKKHDNSPDMQNQQLALALPHQTTLPASLPARAVEPQHPPYKELQPGLTSLPLQQTIHAPQPALPSLPQQQAMHVQHPALTSLPPQQAVHVQSQPNMYYSQQMQLPNQPPQSQQHPQDQHLQAAELQYGQQRTQLQDLSRQAAQPPPHVNQTQAHPFPPYQQQWPQQFPQEAQLQPQAPSSHAQIKPQTAPVYQPYTHQPTNASPETYPGSMPMQVPFSGAPQSGVSRPEAVVYGYGGPGRTVQPQPPQHNMQRQPQLQTNQSSFGSNLGDSGYPSAGPRPTHSSMHGYMMYDTDGSRQPHPPHFQQGSSYPPTHASALQNQQAPPGAVVGRHPNSQIMRNHPYSEIIEKAASMGYPRDQVASVIRRMEESGQPVDFNNLLDRLDARF